MTTKQTTRKENSMLTKTPTAAEARALADRLEAEERTLNARRREARKAAELAAAKAEFNYADTELASAQTEAEARWAAAASADTLNIVDLFDAFLAARTTTREKAQTIAAGNGEANAIAPRYGQGGGQVDYRRDYYDVLTDTAFIPALEQAIRDHVNRRGNEAKDAAIARIREAGIKAEEAV
jgi:hypothetical protein